MKPARVYGVITSLAVGGMIAVAQTPTPSPRSAISKARPSTVVELGEIWGLCTPGFTFARRAARRSIT